MLKFLLVASFVSEIPTDLRRTKEISTTFRHIIYNDETHDEKCVFSSFISRHNRTPSVIWMFSEFPVTNFVNIVNDH